jgi:hypothetical protein
MRARFSAPGLFVALLALACQLALGASVPRTAGLLAPFGIICHADGTPAAPLHRAPNCQFCPLCVAFATPAPTLLSGPLMPHRATARMLRVTPLQRVALAPAPSLLSARPRGPPVA